ncbi:hypothetical protein Tco_0098975 [Tanacetum coccineum]
MSSAALHYYPPRDEHPHEDRPDLLGEGQEFYKCCLWLSWMNMKNMSTIYCSYGKETQRTLQERRGSHSDLEAIALTRLGGVMMKGDVSKLEDDVRKDFFKDEMGNRRSDKTEYEFSYADLPSLSLNDVEDMYLLKIPYTMSETVKGVVYLNQHNIKSLMKLNEVNKLCDSTLKKICDNLLEMVNKNELVRGNKSLKGRDWSNKDIKRSSEILEKIDKTLKHREQLRRLEEYVGGRPKTFDLRLFVAP